MAELEIFRILVAKLTVCEGLYVVNNEFVFLGGGCLKNHLDFS
jgi:hypothetical protein